MSIFNEFGEHRTEIVVRSGADCETGRVKVEHGSTWLGEIMEVDCGDHGGETGELGYFGFMAGPTGATAYDGTISEWDRCSELGSFEEALGAIIARWNLV